MATAVDFIKERVFPGRTDSDFVIYVETGDRRNSGTNAYVYIKLFDDSGNQSEKITLDTIFKNEFKRGQTDFFTVTSGQIEKLNKHGKIARIELWKEDGWISDDWFLDKVVVENRANNSSYVFPMFRWVKNKFHYNIVHLDTSLPQNDAYRKDRELELQEKRKRYVYDQKKPGDGPVQVKDLPDDERFSFEYQFDIALTTRKLQAASSIHVRTQPEWTSIEDMASIYEETIFTKPLGADRWDSDFYFGQQRIASMNSSLIQLVTGIPENFPVTDKLLAPLLEGLTVSQAIDTKRLFLSDLHKTEGISSKEGFIMCSPMALFFLNKSQKLLPVAIQLNQKPGKNNPIFTPLNPPMTWALAKMWYNNADASHHQGVTHLGMTHLLMEGFAVATHRNLAPAHPVFKLLVPHFLYLIAINNLAVESLISEGGWVDRVMNCGSKGLVDLYTKEIQTWRMDVDGNLRENLKRRGLDDVNVLPCYHYRNDVILLYEAIEKYVKAYVHLYYLDNNLLQKDYEIQNWVAELVKARNKSEGGAGILGVPGNGKLTQIEQLTEILTCIIYTCSVLHAAVNFPQYDEYGFPINYPLLLRGTPPTDPTKEMTEADILKAAPDMAKTMDIMTITKILSAQGTNSLGDFEIQYVFDPKAREIISQFRKDLADIDEEIKRRNRKRVPEYEYLLPEKIPNAISI